MKRPLPALLFALSLLLTSPVACLAAAPAPAWGTRGIAATAHPRATEAAIAVLDKGGNAFDAAIAAIYTLDVVTGYSLGLGGGEFWVLRSADGELLCVDGRESAPAASHRDMYLSPDTLRNELGELDTVWAVDEARRLSTLGALAGGVPGSVAAREYVLERWGSMKRKQLMHWAIDAAENGYIIDPHQAEVFAAVAPDIALFPSSSEVLFKQDSVTWGVGDRYRQPDLAATLKRIAKDGADDFYRGETARRIAAAVQKHGGLITEQDLADYEVIVRKPIHGQYRGLDVYSMPPPSSGGVHLVQMMNMLEGWDLAQFGRYSSRYYHHLAEVMKAAFADRSVYLGDPAFVNVPVEGLISKPYADLLRSQIESLWEKNRRPGNPMPFMADPPDSLMKALSDGHTSHLAVIDAEGNMVSLTSSINTWFGSKLVLDDTGIFLNNTMDDFSKQPGEPNFYGLIGSEANAIAPGKRPLSSMTPTLILDQGRPYMAIGAAGGPRIITGTLQSALNVIDFGADISQAIADPRIHHQWAPELLFVSEQISPDVAAALDRMGHVVVHRVPGATVQGVMVDHESGLMFGASDPRTTGSAAGLR